ncbi:MAG: dihydroorotate dehydrogenase-like protein [Gammaproteobacteria bacterium]
MDLSTKYLGLSLKNPLMVSASPLSRSVDNAKRLEDAGAAAIVMYSFFEEELLEEQERLEFFLANQELGNPESATRMDIPDSYRSGLDDYLEQLGKLKASLEIPVIASLNGVSTNGWVRHGKELQEAGADALELNAYHLAADIEETGVEVEMQYVELLTELREAVNIPIAVKLSPQFSCFGNMARRLEQAGADGLVLFNRFYQPDIDLETLAVTPSLQLSSSHELLIAIRWIALLYGRVNLSFAATGGIHTHEDVLKTLLAGANVAQMCSVLLKEGPAKLTEILNGFTRWLEEREYESVTQLIGSVSQKHTDKPSEFERANYMRVLDSFTPPSGVWV